jgi:hypothetical protein
MTSWNDRIIDEHQKRIDEMRFMCATQMKFGLYRNPAFKFFHSMGVHDLFQGFKSDNIDLGVFHFYWDKNAENTIEYIDPVTGERTNKAKGDWRERWYNVGEELQPINKSSIVDSKKMTEFWQRENLKMAQRLAQKTYETMKEYQEEHEPWKELKPFWEN